MLDLPEADLVTVVRTAFEGVFALPVAEASPTGARSPAVSSTLVAITGAWSGAVIVDVPPAFAALLAGRRFGLDPVRVGDGHIAEALAELAIRIGADLETRLDPRCRCSLPTTLEHRDPDAAPPGTAIVRDLCFEVELPTGSARLRVLVAERDAPLAAAREAA